MDPTERRCDIHLYQARIMNALAFAALSVALLASCASHTGIVPFGDQKYMIAKQQATGFPGLGNMKAEIIGEGAAYCRNQGLEFELISTTETKPPYILGNYPRSEITFACVSKRSK